MKREESKKVTGWVRIGFGIMICILITLLMHNCGNKKRQEALMEVIEHQDSIINVMMKRPHLTRQEIRHITRQEATSAMYQFLIYELDLERNKISLSQIKERLEQMKEMTKREEVINE